MEKALRTQWNVPLNIFLTSWPWPLTYKLDLDIIPLDLHAKIPVCMSVRSAVREVTDTNTQTMSKLFTHRQCQNYYTRHVTDVVCNKDKFKTNDILTLLFGFITCFFSHQSYNFHLQKFCEKFKFCWMLQHPQTVQDLQGLWFLLQGNLCRSEIKRKKKNDHKWALQTVNLNNIPSG